MTSIYDRPVRELVQMALTDMPDPFTSRDMVQWFERRYADVNQTTVPSSLRSACVNTPQGASAGWTRDERTVYRIARGEFERYRSEKHGQFLW